MLSLLSFAIFVFSPANASLSQFYFVNELSSPFTELTFEGGPSHIFVATVERNEPHGAADTIYITAGNVTRGLKEATTPNGGYQQSVFGAPVPAIKVAHMNPHQYENPTIIYATKELQKVMTVSEEPTRVELTDTVTFLSPGGLVQLSDFGESWAPVIVTVGGIEETNSKEYTLHGIGSAFAENNSPLLIFEPILTVHKELVGPAVSFNVRGNGDFRGMVEMSVDWNDRVVAMSRGYRLRNTSSSASYEFRPLQNNTEFHVRLSGDIPDASQLTFKDNELGGSSLVTIKGQRDLDERDLHFGGDYLEVEYERGNEDRSVGFYALIEVRQTSRTSCLYVSLALSLSFRAIF